MLLALPPQNMIAQSQSGTGKTAAFVLAMLSRVDTSKNYVQVWLFLSHDDEPPNIPTKICNEFYVAGSLSIAHV